MSEEQLEKELRKIADNYEHSLGLDTVIDAFYLVIEGLEMRRAESA